MAFISDSFPNFADGVSQQPMVLRLPTQGDEQVNGLSDPAVGLSKRPCTEHLAKIGDISTEKSYGTTITRSATEAFFLLVPPNTVPMLRNASTGAAVSVNVTDPDDIACTITRSGSTATVTKSIHGLSNGDKVQVNSAEVSTGSNYFNGEFTVANSQTNTFDYAMSGTPGSNATGSPTYVKVHVPGTTFTASNSSGLLITSNGHNLSDGDIIRVYSSDTLPTGLSANTNYYVRDKTTNTFKLATSSGGTAISYTNVGSGAHTWTGPDYNNICDYVKIADPQSNLRTVSIADETFILNKSQSVSKSSTTVTNRNYKEALVYVKVGGFGSTYKIKVNNTEKTVSVADSGSTVSETITKTSTITSDLVKQLNGGSSPTYSSGVAEFTMNGESSITVTHESDQSVIHFKTANLNTDFTIEAKDSRDFGHMVAFKDTTPDFSKLPSKGPSAINGFEIKVSGDFSKNQDDYYVQAVLNSSTKEVSYTEVPKDNEIHGFDAITLPRRLVRNSDGTYSLKLTNWTARAAGDDETNPFPQFVGKTISDLFYHQGRLGMLSGETLHMSETNQSTNFFLPTVLTSLDTQPIEISNAGTEISLLEFAIPYSESLLLFSKLQQNVLRADNILTSKSASIKTATTFEASLKAKPSSSGKFVFFAEKRGAHTGIREYFVDSSTNTMDAAQITMHVPKYIDGEATQLLASSNADMLLVRTNDSDSEDTIFVYRYTWLGTSKAQASWSKWTFDGKIRGMGFLETDLILIIERTLGGTTRSYIEKLNLGKDSAASETDMLSPVHLDRRVKLTSNSDYSNFATSFYTDAGSANANLIYIDKAGDSKTSAQVGAMTLSSSNPIWAGVGYEFLYRFSEPVVRMKEGQAATTAGRIQLRTMSVNYADTGFFKILIKPQGFDVTEGGVTMRDQSTHVFNGRLVGNKSLKTDKTPILSGTFRFPIYSISTGVIVEIRTTEWMPCSFQGGEWEAQFYKRTGNI